MALVCTVSITKKIGQPDYGSLGASFSVQFELDSMLLQTDLEAFQTQVRNAYLACANEVDNELRRQQETRTSGTTVPTSRPSPSNGNGAQTSSSTNGHGATTKQLDYVRQLAAQIKGLGVRRLDQITQQMFGKNADSLSTLDASGLIDSLKNIKSGQIDLASVLNDGATS